MLQSSPVGARDQPALPDIRKLLFKPNISVHGPITDGTLSFVLDRLSEVRDSNEDLIMELNTTGGDADVARRIALEIRLFRRHGAHGAYCVGKTNVYSAGVTIFASFAPSSRFLTEDAVLLIHERRLEKSIDLNGPMKANIQIIREQLALLETAEKLEAEGFAELVQGSKLSLDALYDRLMNNCYMFPSEALKLNIIQDILQ
ncbi:ATP-dependent Clp protease proteolytic subunit [Rhizobium tubonense]|uniref:ATP-dependent Clp protease proteolytic subunit n=1 Tax=Rhizobium tubonense TaxID=484088 RepID=UPI0018A81DBA|nr:ATP-dependent Clp protease proteolytic subunit [Rhizobium tubonense]